MSNPAPLALISKLLAKLRCYDRIDELEAQALADLFAGQTHYGRGEIFIRAGQKLESSALLLAGFVHRFKDLPDGRRLSLELSVPGDFVDLHSFTMQRIDHDIACLSPCSIIRAPHDRIRKLTADFPHLTRVLWLSTTIDAALHRERIMSLGARSATERLAHFFCETYERLRAVGLAENHGFVLPINQGELAELLGLSNVHMNRTLRELRERDLALFRQHNVDIRDWDELAMLAQFDPTYLGQHRWPR